MCKSAKHVSRKEGKNRAVKREVGYITTTSFYVLIFSKINYLESLCRDYIVHCNCKSDELVHGVVVDLDVVVGVEMEVEGMSHGSAPQCVFALAARPCGQLSMNSRVSSVCPRSFFCASSLSGKRSLHSASFVFAHTGVAFVSSPRGVSPRRTSPKKQSRSTQEKFASQRAATTASIIAPPLPPLTSHKHLCRTHQFATADSVGTDPKLPG